MVVVAVVMVVDMVVGGRETHSFNLGPSNQAVGLINMRGHNMSRE